MFELATGSYLAKTFFELILSYGKDEYIKSELERKFEDVIEKSVEELISGKEESDKLESFFRSSEVKMELKKEGYVFQNISPESLYKYGEKFNILPLEIDEFILFFRKNFYNIKEFDEILANKKINEQLGLISGYIKSIYELQNQSKNFNYNDFYSKYKISMNLKIENIRYFGLGIECDRGLGKKYKKRGMKLEEIYVEPHFMMKNTKKTVSDLLDCKENLVVLGGPGTGKSTFLKYIMYQFLKEDIFFKDTNMYRPIPIFVELKNYLKTLEGGGGLKEYILKSIQENGKLIKISKEDIELMIEKNLVIIFFDGLDEVFDVELKIKIKEEIELLVKFHENLRVIITSRKEGYTEISFEGDSSFVEAEIMNFNADKIEEYVQKWYLFEEENPDKRKIKINEFNDEKNKIDETLLENPLLLSLIIILFTNNGEVPTSKLEIYESCTKTLIIDWEEKKSLPVALEGNLLENKENILVNLAYWQYCKLSEEKEKIVSYHVKKEIASVIQKLGLIENEIRADKFSSIFLDYIQRRSIYFENNFTHKTFLEYYTALWIFKAYETKGKREKVREIFFKYSSNSYWNVVFELLMNMIDRGQMDCEIMDEYYEILSENDQEILPLLIKIVPNLKHISKKKIKSLYYHGITIMLKEAKINPNNRKRSDLGKVYGGNFKAPLTSKIFMAIQENLSSISLTRLLQKVLDDIYPCLSEIEKLHYHILIVELNISNDIGVQREGKVVNNFEKEIKNYLDTPLMYLHNLRANREKDYLNEKRYLKFIEKFSIEESLVSIQFLYIVRRRYGAIIHGLFQSLFHQGKYHEILKYIRKFEITNEELNRIRTPFLSSNKKDYLEKKLSELDYFLLRENLGNDRIYFENTKKDIIRIIEFNKREIREIINY